MGVKVQNALLDRGEKGNPYSWSAAVFKCERREWGKKKNIVDHLSSGVIVYQDASFLSA